MLLAAGCIDTVHLKNEDVMFGGNVLCRGDGKARGLRPGGMIPVLSLSRNYCQLIENADPAKGRS